VLSTCAATLNVVVQNPCTAPRHDRKPHLSVRPEDNEASISVFVHRVFALRFQGFLLDLDRLRGHADMVCQSSTFPDCPQNLGYYRSSMGRLPTQPPHLPTVCHRLVDNPSFPHRSPQIQIALPPHPSIGWQHIPRSPSSRRSPRRCLRRETGANRSQDPSR